MASTNSVPPSPSQPSQTQSSSTATTAVSRDQIIKYCNKLLEVDNYSDYCPNGLQVEGISEVKTIVSGVTACQALLNRAVELDAQLVLVHHGYFWNGEPAEIVGIKRARLATLLKHNINLVGYHLPLDAHSVYGNNAQLAKLLGIAVTEKLAINGNPNQFYIGQLNKPMSPESFSKLITKKLKREPLVIAEGDLVGKIKKIGWCSGAAQDYIEIAVANHCDAFLTGEVSERTFHSARENGICFFAAGHHATERYGIKALGEHLAEKLGLDHQFVDIDNPV